MEYHADRFVDASLLAWNADQLMALLPANQIDGRLISHGGLTFGGFIVDDRMKTPKMLHLLLHTLLHLKRHGFTEMTYKPAPFIYALGPTSEDLYALSCSGALLKDRKVSAVIGQNRIPFQERRCRQIERARKAGLQVRETDQFAEYWRLLEELLDRRHGSAPVHRLDEILLLRSRFPKNITLYGCFHHDRLVAGILVYESRQVARAQYIAADDTGQKYGALDLTCDYLINGVFRSKPYVDLGTSESPGGDLIHGLIDQKEGFGARAVVQDQYLLDLVSWQPDLMKGLEN